ARDGIELSTDGHVERARVRTGLAVAEDLGPAALVLVLVKAPATAAVAAPAARALADDGTLLTLQNGLGNRETLAAAAGAVRVGPGGTLAGFTLRAPGCVRAFPGRTILGTPPPTAAAVARIAALFRDAGIDTDTTPDVASVVWSKLAVNCAINPLTA